MSSNVLGCRTWPFRRTGPALADGGGAMPIPQRRRPFTNGSGQWASRPNPDLPRRPRRISKRRDRGQVGRRERSDRSRQPGVIRCAPFAAPSMTLPYHIRYTVATTFCQPNLPPPSPFPHAQNTLDLRPWSNPLILFAPCFKPSASRRTAI